MSHNKKDVIIYLILVFFVLFFTCIDLSTIFPVIQESQYFEVEEGDGFTAIHQKGCPIQRVKWFCEKKEKYDIMIKHKTRVCSCCFSPEEIEKLYIIHEINFEEYINSLLRSGAPDEYIDSISYEYH